MTTPRDKPNQSQDRRVIIAKRTDDLSDDKDKDQGQPSTGSSKHYHSCRQSSSTASKADKTTPRSTKRYPAPGTREPSASSRKIDKNSTAGTPKRSRDQQPQEDPHQAKKTNTGTVEPKTDEFQAPDWHAGSPTDLENMELPDNQPDEQPDQQQPPISSTSSPSPPTDDPPRKMKADLQPNIAIRKK